MTLPKGWAEVAVGELGNWQGGGTPSKSTSAFWTGGSIPWVSPKDMKRSHIGRAEDYITEAALERSATNLISKGAILLVTRSGILRHSLPVAETTAPVAINQDLKALSPATGIITSFVRYAFEAAGGAILHSCAKAGTTVDSLDFERLRTRPFLLPPSAEQRRIVAKLDALTARLARARSELDCVPKLTRKLRSSVLGAVFALEQAQQSGVRIATVGDVSAITSGFGFPKHLQGKSEGRYLFAKVSDISRAVSESSGRLQRAANYVDDEDLAELRARPIAAGSTVFAKIGEALRLNRRAIAEKAMILDNNCMALTPSENIEPEYLFYFMQTVDLSPFAVATAIPSVRRGDVAALELPLPPLTEQRAAVDAIKTAFARADRLEVEAARARALLDRLEAAILAKAFRGELVPQDPNDEPARVLLERIRTQRAAAPKTRRGRRAKAET